MLHGFYRVIICVGIEKAFYVLQRGENYCHEEKTVAPLNRINFIFKKLTQYSKYNINNKNT